MGAMVGQETHDPLRSENNITADDDLILSPTLPPLPPKGKIGGLGGLGGVDRFSEEIRFRRMLLAFAREYLIHVDGSGEWYFRALRLAAGQHPKLNIHKRQRGRPASFKGGLLAELFGGPSLKGDELFAEEVVRKIDSRNAKLGSGQKRATDAQMAQILAELDNPNTPSLIPATKLKWAKLLSAARKRTGSQKRRRIIPK